MININCLLFDPPQAHAKNCLFGNDNSCNPKTSSYWRVRSDHNRARLRWRFAECSRFGHDQYGDAIIPPRLTESSVVVFTMLFGVLISRKNFRGRHYVVVGLRISCMPIPKQGMSFFPSESSCMSFRHFSIVGWLDFKYEQSLYIELWGWTKWVSSSAVKLLLSLPSAAAVQRELVEIFSNWWFHERVRWNGATTPWENLVCPREVIRNCGFRVHWLFYWAVWQPSPNTLVHPTCWLHRWLAKGWLSFATLCCLTMCACWSTWCDLCFYSILAKRTETVGRMGLSIPISRIVSASACIVHVQPLRNGGASLWAGCSF